MKLKEENHATTRKRGAKTALRPEGLQQPCLRLEELWQNLGEALRREALQTLSRIVARQIQCPHDPKEVRHEDC